MPIQLLLNLFIAFLWMLLSDHWSSLTFLIGFLIGLGLIFLMRRFFRVPFYPRKVLSILKLLYVFFKELITSSLFVMRKVISPQLKLESGVVTLKTNLTSDWEITVLSLLLTLTPGSVVMEVFPEKSLLCIHVMDIPETKEKIIATTHTFEKAILEVTR